MSLISLLRKKVNKTFFTTPSHSGSFFIYHKFYQWYKSDISEIDALDPQKALQSAENEASKIYGTKYTKFLTNGSTSGIIASVLAIKPKRILIWKNAHPCHKNAAELAGAEIIEYLQPYDENLDIYKPIETKKVEELLNKHKADAIIVTSPTYEGFVTDIQKIKNICKSYNTILIVDEAHGALYPFSDLLPESATKIADFTIQSLHKTAGGLNPTALLHSNYIDPSEALAKINTTSPSYPMLATIEANIKFLNSKKGKKQINNLIKNINNLNIKQINDDPTKILLEGGERLSEVLYNKYGIEDEKTSKKTNLLLCGIGTDLRKLKKLQKALHYFKL